jgi:hypothetical protein
MLLESAPLLPNNTKAKNVKSLFLPTLDTLDELISVLYKILPIIFIIAGLYDTIPLYIRYAGFREGIIPDYVTVEVGRNTRNTILPSIFINVPFNLNILELKQLYVKNGICSSIYQANTFCNETMEEKLVVLSCTYKNVTYSNIPKDPFTFKTFDKLMDHHNVWQYDEESRVFGHKIYYDVFNDYSFGIPVTPFFSLLFYTISIFVSTMILAKNSKPEGLSEWESGDYWFNCSIPFAFILLFLIFFGLFY